MKWDNPASARWYAGISRYQWMVLVVASLGWVFDVFEGQVFVASMNEALPALLPEGAAQDDRPARWCAHFGQSERPSRRGEAHAPQGDASTALRVPLLGRRPCARLLHKDREAAKQCQPPTSCTAWPPHLPVENNQSSRAAKQWHTARRGLLQFLAVLRPQHPSAQGRGGR